MKIAINGFGRIGRQIMRIIAEEERDIEVAAINDLTDNETLAHLFKYDSTYGKFGGDIEVVGEDKIKINGKEIKALSEPEPENLPWKDLNVEVVIESTGAFRKRDKAAKHLKAGAEKVILSAPAKDEIDATFVMGVNEGDYDRNKHSIVSNASCTTNCLAPAAKVLHSAFGIKTGLVTTIHSYTNDQRILDLPHKDLRRARSAGLSIIPTTTGAAKAVGLVIPELNGRLNGLAIRVPTPTVSLVDLVCVLDKKATADEVNETFKKAADNELKGILDISYEPLVSVDYRGSSFSSIIDAGSTQVIGDNLVKILAWYDNEWGYSERLVDLVEYIGKE